MLHARYLLLIAALSLTAAFAPSTPAASSALRINGSTTVNPVVAVAAEVLRAERAMEIVVDTQGGSSGGIAALGDGRADMAMASRPLNGGDWQRYPTVDFVPHRIGSDAVALVVSKDVWERGVHSLSREEMRGIYEGRIRNWQELGGPDRRIVFFNKEPGRGTWEVLATWLYDDADDAPLVSHPEVGANEEGRQKVSTTRGALTPLSAAWADGERTFALGVRLADGTVVTASNEEVAADHYPLARPLLMITDGAPSADARIMLDYLLSSAGQALVEKQGYLALAPSRVQAGAAP